ERAFVRIAAGGDVSPTLGARLRRLSLLGLLRFVSAGGGLARRVVAVVLSAGLSGRELRSALGAVVLRRHGSLLFRLRFLDRNFRHELGGGDHLPRDLRRR